MSTAEQVVEAVIPESAPVESTLVDGKIMNLPDPNQDPMEVAAMMFSLYLPKFHQVLNTLSNKALRRVLNALIEVPLVSDKLNHKSENEKNAFSIGERLLEAKMIMVMHSMYEHSNSLQAATNTDSVTTEETANQSINKKEESNGT